MGDLLLAGMLIGGIGGAIKNNSADSIKNACDGFSDANKQLEENLQTWTKITADADLLHAQATDFGNTITGHLDFYKQKRLDIHDAFRQQELETMIIIAVFIFIIILTLLMRYFNVYGNIWNLIVGNK
jgi:hypothetical protein